MTLTTRATASSAATSIRIRPTAELVWIETHNHIELYDQDPYVSQASC